MDLICANFAANTLTVLTNNGRGQAQDWLSSPAVGNAPSAITRPRTSIATASRI